MGYHYGASGFSGGFVGVDVFFVISGYLITSLLLRAMERGDFSLADFYERRVRRIFPALFVMLAVTYVAGALVLLPSELEALGKGGLATLTFVSNVLFWSQTGYFDAPAATKPLLHTWSLSVEEQFYILFPPLLYFLFRRSRPRLNHVLLILATASLAVGIYQVSIAEAAAAAFFLPFGRAWELLAGALLALPTRRVVVPAYVAAIAALAGLAAILASVILLDSRDPFPGLGALPSVLGAAALIWAGRVRNPVSSFMGIRPLVAVGLISYSLYLWHWPVLVLSQLYTHAGHAPLQKAVMFLLSVILSVLSWRYIEQPFRRSGLSRPAVFRVAGIAGGALGGIAFMFANTDGLPARMAGTTADTGGRAEMMVAMACLVGDPRADQGCVLGGGGPPSFILWGDSHAGAFVPGFDRLAAEHGFAGRAFGIGGCPPLPGVTPTGAAGCVSHTRSVLDYALARETVTTVVLSARWGLYVRGAYLPHEAAEEVVLTDDSGASGDMGENPLVVARNLDKLLEQLTGAGLEVVLVGPVPEVGYDVPRTVAALRFTGRELDMKPVREEFEERQETALEILEAAAERRGVTVVWPHRILCRSSLCDVARDGRLLYADDDHLSPFGARLVVEQLSDLILPALAHTPVAGHASGEHPEPGKP